MQGLKLRVVRVVQAPLMIDMLKAMGTEAVPLPFTERHTAMESKAVDGQDNPIVAFQTNKFYEVKKYVSTTRRMYNPLMVLFSRKRWKKLSPDERKILVEAANETRVEQRAVSRETKGKALAKMKRQGTAVTAISFQERKRMREKVQPATERYTRQIGAALVQEFYAEIDKVWFKAASDRSAMA